MSHHRMIVVADHHKSVFVCQVLDRETGEIVKKTFGSRRQELEPFLRELPRPALVYVEACRGPGVGERSVRRARRGSSAGEPVEDAVG